MTRTCTGCGETKPLSEFSPKTGRNGKRTHRPRCKACVAVDHRARRARERIEREVCAYTFPKALPRRRPGSQKSRIQDALLAEIENLRNEDSMPTTNRFLYYRLVAAGVVKKGDRAAAEVSAVSTELREAQIVGMDEIRDRSRGVTSHVGWHSIAGAAVNVAYRAKLDRWPEDETPILVVESNSLAGVLEDIAIEYRVIVAPLGGTASCGLLGGEIAPMLSEGQAVLYLGDWDYSGAIIEESARRRLEAYAGVSLDWRRVALTEAQVTEHGLTVIEKFDGRTKTKHPAVETEALDQRILLPLVRDALDALGPADVAADEERQRAEVLKLLGISPV
jgi:hypothetical protein